MITHITKYLFVLLCCLSSAYAQKYEARLAAHRETYKSDFLTDAHAPLKEAELPNLRFYDGDSTYAIIADIQLLENEKPFKMSTSAGTERDYLRYAILKFKLNGQAQQLTLYKSVKPSANPAFQDYLFLPFKDRTNGKETYGGGRYIDLFEKDIKDGKIAVDFNKAYNPYCAYSDGYQCPLTPFGNHLKIAVPVGEKQYAGEKKHLK